MTHITEAYGADGARLVRRSYQCWLAASVVYVVGSVIYLALGLSRFDQAVAVSGSPPPPAGILTTFLVVIIVLVLIGAALVVFFAAKMRAGRQWARIVLTVLGILAIAGNLPALSGSSSFRINGEEVALGAATLLGIGYAALTILLVLAALILQWRPTTTGHFQQPVMPPAAPPPPPAMPPPPPTQIP